MCEGCVELTKNGAGDSFNLGRLVSRAKDGLEGLKDKIVNYVERTYGHAENDKNSRSKYKVIMENNDSEGDDWYKNLAGILSNTDYHGSPANDNASSETYFQPASSHGYSLERAA